MTAQTLPGPRDLYALTISVLNGVPDALRGHREFLGISQREAARRIGVSFSTVSRIEGAEYAEVKSYLAVLRWLQVSS